MKNQTLLSVLRAVVQHEDINFLLTNRVPRNLVTRLAGWFSKVRSPLLCRITIRVWQLFTDINLEESAEKEFASLHDCFTRSLKPGARAVDPDPNVLASPCDGIVGQCGTIKMGEIFQAKGFTYALSELLGSVADAERFEGGVYVTLRLTSAMYHRFHAPHDLDVNLVNYIGGDTWNVNPIALRRVERLFCKNERAVIHARLKESGHAVALVPVAAILVASIRLHFANVLLHLKYPGPNRIPCNAAAAKGQEMGWFEHGSTMILLAPKGFSLCSGIRDAAPVRMGEALMRLPG